MAYFKNVELDRTDFDSEEDYNRALIEQNRIEKINQNVDITDPLVAKALLDGFRLHPEMFRTIVGNEFIEVLQENCKELEEEIAAQQQAQEVNQEEPAEESEEAANQEESEERPVEAVDEEEPAEESEEELAEPVKESEQEPPVEAANQEEPAEKPVETVKESEQEPPVEAAIQEESEERPVEAVDEEEPAEEPTEEPVESVKESEQESPVEAANQEKPAEESEEAVDQEKTAEESTEESTEEPTESVKEFEQEPPVEAVNQEEPVEEFIEEVQQTQPESENQKESDADTESRTLSSNSKVESAPATEPELQANIEQKVKPEEKANIEEKVESSDTANQIPSQVVSQQVMNPSVARTSDLGENSRMKFAIMLFIYSVVTVCFPVVGAGVALLLFVISFLHTFYRYYKTGLKPSMMFVSLLCIIFFPVGILLTIIGCMKKIKYIVLNYKILISAFLFYFIPVWLFLNLSMLNHGPMLHLIPVLAAMFLATGTFGKLAFLCNLFLGIAIGLYLVLRYIEHVIVELKMYKQRKGVTTNVILFYLDFPVIVLCMFVVLFHVNALDEDKLV